MSVDTILAVLRSHQEELHSAGIRRLSIFGSAARGESQDGSDVDLAAELDPVRTPDLFQLTAIERRLSEVLGRPVDLVLEPTEKQRLQAHIERDRRIAF